MFIVLMIGSLSLSSYCADPSTMFFKGGMISVAQQEPLPIKIYGIKASPVLSEAICVNREAVFHHIIENVSNSSVKIKIIPPDNKAISGWSCNIYRDKNKPENFDVKKAKLIDTSAPIELSEGSQAHFVVLLTSNGLSKVASAEIKVESLSKDGKEYMGYNGISYGGEDEVVITDTAIIQ